MRRGTEPAYVFGKFLRENRTNSGLTQTAVAKKLGVVNAAVSQVELGVRVLKIPMLRKWAKAYSIPFDQIVSEWERVHDSRHVQQPGPIVRSRKTSIEKNDLTRKIEQLTAAERTKVSGYVDGLLDSR